MSRGKDLIKNTVILTIAKISTQIISFLLLPLYTSLLSTEEYGRVDIYTSLSMIIIPILTLQIEMAVFRFFITSKSDAEKREIISSSFAVVTTVFIIVTIGYLFVTTFIAPPNSKLLVLSFYLLQAMSMILLQVCRAEGDNIGYGVAVFLSSVIAVVLNVLFILVFKWRVEGILLSTILAQLISLLYLIFKTKIKLFIQPATIKMSRCKELLCYSVPLIFNQIASWAINYSDRILILFFWGEGMNGIYSVANKFSNITNSFFNVFNIAWTENIVRSMDDKDCNRYLSEVYGIIFAVYLIIITAIINIIPFAFNVFVGADFRDAYQHIPILLVAMFFSGMSATIGSIYIAYKRTKEVSITTILAGICNISVHLLMISEFNLYAASVSTLVSFLVLFICRCVFLKRFFVLKTDYKTSMLQIFILIISWYGYSAENTFVQLIGLILNVIYVIFFVKMHFSILLGILKKQ